jgi:hypothetical protein
MIQDDVVSHVTNMMVCIGPDDHETVQAVSEWLRTSAARGGKPAGYLLEITGQDSRWGGWKFPECDVWAGTLNHADLDAVLDHIRHAAWKNPHELQVLLQDQHEAFFRVWMIRDGELRQYAPAKPDERDAGFFPED